METCKKCGKVLKKNRKELVQENLVDGEFYCEKCRVKRLKELGIKV